MRLHRKGSFKTMRKILSCLMLFITLLFCSCGKAGVLTGSESFTESRKENPMPFKNIDRDKIESDNLPLLCKPKISGDFIQSWLAADWSVDKWENHFQVLKASGFEFIIIQNTTSKEKGLYTEFFYPSNLASDSVYSAVNCKVHSDMVKNAFEAAKRTGFKIVLGIGDSSDEWWSCKFKEVSWCVKEAETINKTIKELYDLYYNDYSDVFMGWYWSPEMYTTKSNYEVNWSEMLSRNLDYMTVLNPSLPCIISPFISKYEDASPKRIKEQYTYLFNHTRFRKGDVFAPQDGIGVLAKDYYKGTGLEKEMLYTLEHMEKIMKAYKEACSLNTNVEFWYNVECYTVDNKGGAPIERFIDQIQLDAKYATKLITFSYSHYYHPFVIDSADKNKDYQKYLKWVEHN